MSCKGGGLEAAVWLNSQLSLENNRFSSLLLLVSWFDCSLSNIEMDCYADTVLVKAVCAPLL